MLPFINPSSHFPAVQDGDDLAPHSLAMGCLHLDHLGAQQKQCPETRSEWLADGVSVARDFTIGHSPRDRCQSLPVQSCACAIPGGHLRSID